MGNLNSKRSQRDTPQEGHIRQKAWEKNSKTSCHVCCLLPGPQNLRWFYSVPLQSRGDAICKRDRTSHRLFFLSQHPTSSILLQSRRSGCSCGRISGLGMSRDMEEDCAGCEEPKPGRRRKGVYLNLQHGLCCRFSHDKSLRNWS